MTKSTHVPGQLLGYSIQTTRMVCLLLEHDSESTVSLEVFDDVGVEDYDGNIIAQQVKSTISEANPIADFSRDLWKTFSNWLDSIECGELDPNRTIFQIYISKPKKGNFAKRLSATTNNDGVEEILTEIEKKYKEKTNLAEDILIYINHVFNSKRSTVYTLFKNFELIEGNGDSIAELEKTLKKNPAIPKDIIHDVSSYLLGWVKKNTDSQIENKLPAIIHGKIFRDELQNIIRKLDRGIILNNFAPAPQEDEINLQKNRNYVLQLSIINVDEATQLQAINDYLRSSVNRTEWANRGWVTEDGFSEFEEDLKRAWNNYNLRINVLHKILCDDEKGTLLFVDCSNHKTNLQGVQVPDTFIAGSFHVLADILDIGWHPHYKDILRQVFLEKI